MPVVLIWIASPTTSRIKWISPLSLLLIMPRFSVGENVLLEAKGSAVLPHRTLCNAVHSSPRACSHYATMQGFRSSHPSGAARFRKDRAI